MNLRKTWFTNRAVRHPDETRIALLALKDTTNNFNTNVKWNRNLQLSFEHNLGKRNVKSKTSSTNGSGGRTWLALFKLFNYVYLTSNKIIRPTKITKYIINNIGNTYKNICKQILNLQIPNAYFTSSYFRPKFTPDFKIHPIRFLLRLISNKKLNYKLYENEIIYFGITSHKDTDVNSTVSNILKFRSLSSQKKTSWERSISKNNDHRSKSAIAKRSFYNYARDIANTYMILTTYTNLVQKSKNNLGNYLYSNKKDAKGIIKRLNNLDNSHPFDNLYKSSKKNFILHEGLPVGATRANRNPGKKVANNNSKEKSIIKDLMNFNPNFKYAPKNQIRNTIIKNGINPATANNLADSIKEKFRKVPAFSKKFVSRYLHEKARNGYKKDRCFEIDSLKVLKVMKLAVKPHPKPSSSNNNTNENEDTLINIDNKFLILVDDKNYHKTFRLTNDLKNTMIISYIEGYQNYPVKTKNGIVKINPKCFLYIVANKASSGNNMERIKNESGCSGAIISSKCLLDIANYEDKNKTSKHTNEQYLLKICLSNKIFEYFDQVKDYLKLK